MTLQAAVLKIQEHAKNLSGIRSAPATPPETVGVYPFTVCYPRTGNFDTGDGVVTNFLHTLLWEIHFNRASLLSAISMALPLPEAIQQALCSDPTLGGTVSTIREVRYTFGKMEWSGVETVGYRFEIDIKIR